jgi:hypothetical protein
MTNQSRATENTNDCVHHGSFSDKKDNCGIFAEPCDEPAWQKGCYFSIRDREQLLKGGES